MAWTTPRTWSPGETVTASLMNAHLRDNLNIVKTPITDAGLIQAINGTYFSSLNGAALTGVNPPLKVDVATHQGSGTGETDATTYTLPGGTLGTDGDALLVRFWGKTAAGGSTRTIKFWWNGAALITSAIGIAAGTYDVFVIIQRVSNTSQTARCLINFAAAGLNTATPAGQTTSGTAWDTPNATLSGNVAVKTTVQDSAAGANITQLGFTAWAIRT